MGEVRTRVHRGIDLDARKHRERFGLKCEDPSLTQQHQAKDADINVIVERFGVTGMLPQRMEALNLGAFDEIFDYQTAMNAVVAANRAFEQVPAEIRRRFDNDPQQFIDFATNPQNADELRKLKLWNPIAEKPPEIIQKVEVVNPAVPSSVPAVPPVKP